MARPDGLPPSLRFGPVFSAITPWPALRFRLGSTRLTSGSACWPKTAPPLGRQQPDGDLKRDRHAQARRLGTHEPGPGRAGQPVLQQFPQALRQTTTGPRPRSTPRAANAASTGSGTRRWKHCRRSTDRNISCVQDSRSPHSSAQVRRRLAIGDDSPENQYTPARYSSPFRLVSESEKTSAPVRRAVFCFLSVYSVECSFQAPFSRAKSACRLMLSRLPGL